MNSPLTPETIAVAKTIVNAIKTNHEGENITIILAGLTSAIFLAADKMGIGATGAALGLMMCSKTGDIGVAELNENGVSF